LKPESLLRSFIGDLTGISNYISNPRADSYGSNGSDEREFAQAWLERAHGMNAIDWDELDTLEQEEAELEAEREDFADLLDDFKNSGGEANELFKAVQQLIERIRN